MLIEKSTPVAPCEEACPAGIDAPRYIRAILSRDFDMALAINREKTPFPSVCAYACPAPCEVECRLNAWGKPIAIKALKRLAVEKGRVNVPEAKVKSTGKKAAIIGSGPAGLTAAYFLARKGHTVTVFEVLAQLGGSLRAPIPENCLPGIILDEEIDSIKKVGINVITGTKIGSVDLLLDRGYDAVFLATGAGKSTLSGVPPEDIQVEGRIKIHPYKMSTSRKGLFAGGDMVTKTASVIDAIGAGRKAAISIDQYLGGSGNIAENLVPVAEEVAYLIPDLSAVRVATVFASIEGNLEVEAGINECKRCSRCDIPVYIETPVCTGCAACEKVCSGDVIRMSVETHKAIVKYPQHCWTCYNCELACPVGAIKISPIERQRPLAWKIGQGHSREI